MPAALMTTARYRPAWLVATWANASVALVSPLICTPLKCQRYDSSPPDAVTAKLPAVPSTTLSVDGSVRITGAERRLELLPRPGLGCAAIQFIGSLPKS